MLPRAFMFPTLPFLPAYLESHCVVDVRTPLEFSDDHLPGAINVPLLTDDERVEIGTLYKQQGPLVARRRGLERTAHRFPAMVEQISTAANGRPLLVYCWRGGLRSGTVAAILDLTGFEVIRLEGGYKGFRQQVTSFFEPYLPQGPVVVIHGMTGIGKTTIISHLKGSQLAVVDLEALASHRGSAFGELGLTQNLSQKRFETLLWDELRRIPP
ncbi:MAG TPA: tRNA 2-selenouridine(34) synthase MnmH, partial [Geobacterales bacterium]|nr:tRNA 2-selenouridine(34) synthase MnmH [Geobacterales bacterium]